MEKLNDLAKRIRKCTRCPLYKTAHLAVPGEGNQLAELMFVGEAPGRYEDESGRPFVGRAGKLLEELIKSLELKREDVFITSVVKHRPPKNRYPKPQEVHSCTPWLTQQLEIIKPKIIIPLGRLALEYFLGKKKISEVHGKLIRNQEKLIFPVYHPAAGLCSTDNKNKLFADFLRLKSIIEEDGT